MQHFTPIMVNYLPYIRTLLVNLSFFMFLHTLNPVLDYPDAPFSEWCNQSLHNLDVMPQSKYSGVSGCSDAVSQGSGGSTRSTELVLGEEFYRLAKVRLEK